MPPEAGKLHREIAARLRQAGVETPMLDARLIVCHVSGLSNLDLIARPNALINEAGCRRIDQFAQRRMAGEPVSRLLGSKEFFGRVFKVTPATLDPRPDTEIVVEACLRLLHPYQSPTVLDLGAGTGAIAITLLCEHLLATAVACDISESALEVCRENSVTLKVDKRLTCLCSNWFSSVSGAFDLIVSNPPYIPAADIAGVSREVRDHDPLIALDGGTDGLDAYRHIFSHAAEYLKPGGSVVVEFGAAQHDGVVEVADYNSMALRKKPSGLIRDLAGTIRCAVFSICK